jgi:hypothetical protein
MHIPTSRPARVASAILGDGAGAPPAHNPGAMNQDSRVVGIVLVLVVVGGGAWFLWRSKGQTPPPPTPAAPPQPAPPPPTPPDAAPEPAIRHPIQARSKPQPLPGLDEADEYVKNALVDLLGRKPVAGFLNVDGMIRRIVATVDNLANERASLHLWPVKATPGRFQTEARGEGTVVAPRNAERYAPFVRFAEGIDTGRAVQLYVRLYPLFQQAYEDLGYPGKYFNDRLVEVIDHLLATPAAPEPLEVKRLEVPGATRPDPLYQLGDPALERLSAGQKILLRVGSPNAERLKAKLAEIRRHVASPRVERKLGAP